MALSSENNRNGYVGDGATADYDYTFLILAATHLLVKVRDLDGTEYTLVKDTDYTVDGVNEVGGGTVTLIGAGAWLSGGFLIEDYVIIIRRKLPVKQETDIRNQERYFASVHEDTFDTSRMIDQQQQDEIDRSVKLPETITDDDFDPTLPTTLAENPGAALLVNDTGDGLTLGQVGTSIDRFFKTDTFANLKTLAATTPTAQRFGFATDLGATGQLMFYCGNIAGVGSDDGWYGPICGG